LKIGKPPKIIFSRRNLFPVSQKRQFHEKSFIELPPALLAFQEGQANHPLMERQEKWSDGGEI
jgi:hypothetical protein